MPRVVGTGLRRLGRRAQRQGWVGAAALADAHAFGLLGLGTFANKAVCVHGAKASREQGTHGGAGGSPRRPAVARGIGALASCGPALWGTKGHNT
jgi:hypothetical protein